MTFQEVLAALRDPARREAGGAELLRALGALARTAATGADHDELEQLVYQVATRVLEVAQGSGFPSHVGWGYPKAMLHNVWVDQVRRDQAERTARERLKLLAPVSQPAHDASPPRAEAELWRELRARFDRLLEEALRRRRACYREDLRQGAEQLWALAVRTTTMTEVLVAEGLTDDAGDRMRKRLVNRLLKRHERVRRALVDAVAHLERDGRVDGAEADELRLVHRHLFRCQRSAPPAVPPGERPPEGDGKT